MTDQLKAVIVSRQSNFKQQMLALLFSIMLELAPILIEKVASKEQSEPSQMVLS